MTAVATDPGVSPSRPVDTRPRVELAALDPIYACAGAFVIGLIAAVIGFFTNNLLFVYEAIGLSVAVVFISVLGQPTLRATKPTGPAASQSTSVLSILAIVAACFTGLAVVAIVLGHVARNQISRDGGQGDGLALAALIVGYAEIFLGVLLVVFLITFLQANL